MLSDEQSILRDYVQTRSEAAFQALVDRYINIVYAAARRQTGDAHLAEDVTQAVFIVLAQRAGQIPSDRALCPWLLRTAAYCASTARRARDRRNRTESRAAAMSPTQTRPDLDDDGRAWQEIAPMLDEGLSRLRPGDRDVLLWRFFESRTAAQIGQMLGISEHAASKRVSRAAEKLRDFFSRRGVTVSAGALGVILAGNTAEAAPAALVGAVSSGATLGAAGAAGTSSAAAIAKGALVMTAATNVKSAAIAAVIGLLVVGGAAVVVVKSIDRESDAHVTAQTAPVAEAPAAQTALGTPPALQPTAPGATPSAVSFPGGAVAQVLGIGDGHDENAAAWWAPDGTAVAAPKFPGRAMVSAGQSAGYREIQFIVLLTAAAPDNNLTVSVSSNRGTASTSQTLPGNGGVIHKIVAAVADNVASVDLTFGYAAGPWTEQVLWTKDGVAAPPPPASGPASTAPALPYRVTSVTEQNGETYLVTAVTFPRGGRSQNQRVMAVLAGGKQVYPHHSQGTQTGQTFRFKCAKDQIEKIVFSSRPYAWSELKDVSVVPVPAAGL